MIDFSIPYYREILDKVYHQMLSCDRENIKIIHADEAVFTHSTLGKRAWSRKLENISVYEQKMTIRTHAIVAGISEDRGLETYVIQPKSIKTDSYV